MLILPLLYLAAYCVVGVDSKSVHFFPTFSYAARSGDSKSWWGWAWGAESTVSVVDRSPAVSFSSRPAAFGAEISNPILGYVIPLSSFTSRCSASVAKPNTGCPKLCIDGPHQPEPSETWIALVQRGECEFVSKVREAQRLGARAVVVGGEDPEISGLPDTLINMFSPVDASDVDIAATFIRYSDYEELSRLISSSNTSHSGLRTLSLLITAEYSAWEWYSPVVTFIIILLLPSLLTFITLLIHRLRAARAAQRDRAPEDVVKNLPCRIWTGKGWEKIEAYRSHPTSSIPSTPNANVDLELGVPRKPSPINTPPAESEQASSSDDTFALALQQPWFDTQVECAICLNDFVKGDKVRVLPCFHIFHMDEVDEWLIKRKKTCPICKKDVTLRPGQDHPEGEGASSPPPQGPQQSSDERTPLLRSEEFHATYNTDDH